MFFSKLLELLPSYLQKSSSNHHKVALAVLLLRSAEGAHVMVAPGRGGGTLSTQKWSASSQVVHSIVPSISLLASRPLAQW